MGQYVKAVLLSLAAGIISGVINTLYVSFGYDGGASLVLLALSIIPGLIYGIFTGLIFIQLFFPEKKFGSFLLWILASAGSYKAGTYTFASLTSLLDAKILSEPVAMALSGVAGALVLSVAFYFLFQKIQRNWIIAIVSVGAITAFGVNFLVQQNPNGPAANFGNIEFYKVLYITWQSVITLMLSGAALAGRKSSSVARGSV
jgi:hypothetical protein